MKIDIPEWKELQELHMAEGRKEITPQVYARKKNILQPIVYKKLRKILDDLKVNKNI
jgi:hypothetical protein